MKAEQIALLLVVLPMALVCSAVAWIGIVSRGGPDGNGTVVINLTGVAADGVWTLEAVNGLNYWWKTFEPATLYVTEGDEVIIMAFADLEPQEVADHQPKIILVDKENVPLSPEQQNAF